MNRFEELLRVARETILEAMPPSPAPETGEAPPTGEPMGMPGSALPGMEGGSPEPKQDDMDNEAKKDVDPNAYTEETLSMLVDPQEGISPEMFSDWIDTFGVGLSKVRDKEGFKRFYGDFYNKLQEVMEVKEQLKDIFGQLHSTLKDVISNKSGEPDNAGGGAGMAGPAGPGV